MVHSHVVEAGATPISDSPTGHGVLAYVVLTPETATLSASEVGEKFRARVADLGPIAKSREVIAVPNFPETRSGKLMHRLLAQLYEGEELGDRSSLPNEEALDAIAEALAERQGQTGTSHRSTSLLCTSEISIATTVATTPDNRSAK